MSGTGDTPLGPSIDHRNRRTVGNIQKKLAKWSKRNAVSRRIHAKSDKAKIASWRLELDKSLQVFKVSYVAWMRHIVDPPRSEGVRD